MGVPLGQAVAEVGGGHRAVTPVCLWPGAHPAHAPVHRAAAGLPGRALGRHVHCGLPGLPLHPHPHGATPHVPAQPHLHRPGNEVCKWPFVPWGRRGGCWTPGDGRAGGPSLPLTPVSCSWTQPRPSPSWTSGKVWMSTTRCRCRCDGASGSRWAVGAGHGRTLHRGLGAAPCPGGRGHHHVQRGQSPSPPQALGGHLPKRPRPQAHQPLGHLLPTPRDGAPRPPEQRWGSPRGPSAPS